MADEGISLPSGYEYDFVSTVLDEYHCIICHLPLREPVLTRCGHRYCKKCLYETIRRNRQQVPECPADREPLDPEKDIFPDKATERNVLSCHVRCPSDRCNWTGETRYVETHLESCGYKIIHCPNSNCDTTMERRLVDNHVANMCEWRLEHCGYCEEQHAKCHEEQHASECRRFPTDCSNGCGQVIAREEIANHIENDCPLTLISCPYLQMGCKTKIQQKQMESHLLTATGVHLDLACVRLNETQDQLNKAQVQLNETRETTRELMKKVDALQRELNEKLTEQQQNKRVEKTVMQMEPRKSFTWKIEKFSKIMREAKSGYKTVIESVPFCTEICGYKLKVLLFPNGTKSGKNTHLSVFNVVMKGEFDAILPWPFQKSVKFRLIDQQRLRENVEYAFTHSVPCRPNDNSNNRGYVTFISHEKLKTRRYLVDDTLFLQVEVGPVQ